MADIILQTKNGTAVTYEGVKEIKMATADGGTQTFGEPFLMSSAYFYFYRPTDDDNMEITYKTSGLGKGATGIAGGFGLLDCQKYGYQNSLNNDEWAVGVLVTKNGSLTVGGVYSTEYALNG